MPSSTKQERRKRRLQEPWKSIRIISLPPPTWGTFIFETKRYDEALTRYFDTLKRSGDIKTRIPPVHM